MTLYDNFIEQLMQQPELNVAEEICKLVENKIEVGDRLKFQQVDKLKEWLDSFRPFSPILVAELKKIYDVQFTYNSNAIEGNTLTQSETELVLSKGITIGGKTLQEHLEVVGHQDAINYIETLARKDSLVGEWEIKQIHNLILRAIAPEEAGKYRQLDVKAAGTSYVYPAHYLLPQLMTEFVSWLNSEAKQTLHPIEYATLAHFRFVSIHPFRDGNGRTARLLMNLLLLQTGYPVVVISNQIRHEYINAVAHGQQNKQDIKLLLNIILDATYKSLVETLTIVATARDSRGKGENFHEEMIGFLKVRH
ncbi:MAG: Fic family protein [Spirulinaceae cyanobacterium]